MSDAADIRAYANNYEHLEDELRALDLLIRRRIRTLALHSQAAPESQTSRAVYITPAEVDWLLSESETPVAEDAEITSIRAELEQLRAEIDGRIARTLEAGVFLALPQLAHLFGLSPFETEAIVICLAPELRRKYDRLYAYLQDDITRKRPSVDLVLELLCDTESRRWSASRFLSDTESLVRSGLLRKVDDRNSPSGSSGLAQFLKLDARICEYLLGSRQIDSRLAGQARICRPTGDPDQTTIDPAITAGLLSMVEHHLAGARDRRKLVLHLHGPQGVGKREFALHICRQFNNFLLSIDTELLLAQGAEAENLLRLAFREGLLQRAFVYLDRSDALLQPGARPLLEALQVAISEYGCLVFLSGEAPWTHRHAFTGCLFHSTALPVPDVPVRATIWEKCLATSTSEAPAWAAELASRFRLTPGQIRRAVEMAGNRQIAGQQNGLTIAQLAAACRDQSNPKLRELAVKIEPRHGWDDLVLSEDKLAHLREICSQVRNQFRVFGAWGFGKKLNRGKGLSVVFTGAAGTGKTMAAEVLACDLQVDLYKVDLSGVVSKYIGETEKNLARVFAEAETSNAILFFDEADALFGKRTAVSDAHDRYANIETSYLLQKMEEYEGMVILATNLSENMDEAFTRRIRFIVEFPFPDHASRRRIWKTHFPAEAPVSAEIDCEYLAREFKVAGGSIRNIVLNAAFLAAGDGGTIGLQHILQGARREFEKMGKLWNNQVPARSAQAN
jgi:ATP-dependent 26S proteasome regulatory subunit